MNEMPTLALPIGVAVAVLLALGLGLILKKKKVRRARAWPLLAAVFIGVLVIAWTTGMSYAPDASALRHWLWIPFLGVGIVLFLVMMTIRNSRSI